VSHRTKVFSIRFGKKEVACPKNHPPHAHFDGS
jgi:hypothetical protein